MKKIFFAPILLVLLLITSCGESTDGFKINGEIKGLSNQEIVLEYLSPTAVETIDTAMTDENGKFVMEGTVLSKGFYRLINGQKFWIILLENTELNLVADANDKTLRDLKVTGYKAGEEFLNSTNFLMSKQDEFKAESQKIEMVMRNPASTDVDKQAAQAGFKSFQDNIMASVREKISSIETSAPYSAIYLLSSLNPQEDLAFIKEKVAVLEKSVPESIYLTNIKEMIAKIEEDQKAQPAFNTEKQDRINSQTNSDGTGQVAEEIVMNNPEGKPMKLSDLRGKVVLVDFWASWCKPCRRENPTVVKMYHKYKNKGFDIFSVSLDKSADRWKQAIAQDGLVWKNHVSDLKFWSNAAAKAWGVSSIPATFLLDKEGNVIGRNLRGAALEAKLAEVLN